MAWLPMVKKFEDIFIRFGATHERDRRTDRQTPHAGNSRALMHSIARQKCTDVYALADASVGRFSSI